MAKAKMLNPQVFGVFFAMISEKIERKMMLCPRLDDIEN
jgi:hypothetical protein